MHFCKVLNHYSFYSLDSYLPCMIVLLRIFFKPEIQFHLLIF